MGEKLPQKLLDLWFARQDCYARQYFNPIQNRKAFTCVKEPVTLQLIEAHLKGKDWLGSYQLSKNNMVKWGCLDFDADTQEDYEKAKKLYAFMLSQGLHPLAEFSGGGLYKVHLWIFGQSSAKDMQIFLKNLCDSANIQPHEIFPKQETITEFGNLVKLPLGIHLVTKKKSQLLDSSFSPVDNVESLLDYYLNNQDTIPQSQESLAPEAKQLDSSEKKSHAFDNFFNAVLKKELPPGVSIKPEDKLFEKIEGVNGNLLKNEARWFYEKGYTLEQLKQEIKPIFDANKWAFGDLRGWFKKSVIGDIIEINEHELKQYCLTFCPDLIKLLPSYTPDEFQLETYTDADLIDYIPKNQTWLIENQIPHGEVGLMVGKRGERKTFTALAGAIHLASGKDFVGDKVLGKKKVLIVDEESGQNEIAKRVKAIKKGLGIEKEKLDIKFVSFAGLKLDQRETKKFFAFAQLLKEFKPDLIIVDCLARVVTFEVDKDNAAISDLFTSFVRPTINMLGCTWLFIHHLRKSMSGNNKHPEDPLDEVRGGSELVNYCRFVLMCQAPRGQVKSEDGADLLVYRALKMSNSQMPEPKVISFSNSDKGLVVSYEGLPEDVLSGEVHAANGIKEWLISESLTVFETKQANEAADKIGCKKSLISMGLNLLVKQNFLRKVKRGFYEVADSKLLQKRLE